MHECLCHVSSIFKKSRLRVAGLDVEYITASRKEKDLKKGETARPTVIQVCVDNYCLVYHICNANKHYPNFAKFLNAATIKSFSVGIENDSKVLGRSPLNVVGHLDL